jgi:predicted AlkP superfamily phosphohydrolase/phosphomutase
MKRKTILFGIDGATWDIVDKFVKEGTLPHLKHVLENGVKGVLLSTFPTETMAAWTSIFTGVNPGKHGMPDFRLRINDDIEIVGSNYRMVETIWQILSRKGFRSIIINDPVTYPADPINGIMTTGLMTPPNLNYVYPPTMRREIDNAVGGYLCEPPANFYEKAMNAKPEAYEMLEEVAIKQAKAALYLAKNYEWDILAPIFTTSDRLQHVFFSDLDYIRKHYVLLDQFLKEFLELASDEGANVLIASDHGFGPIRKAFYINTWLNRMGLQKIKKSFVRSALASTGLTVYKLMALMGKLRLAGIALTIYRMNPKMVNALPLGTYEEGQIDYSASKAYSTAYHGIYLNVNLKGTEYEHVRETVMNKLYNLTDNGIRIVEKLYKREEVIWGQYSDRAPDIFVVTKLGYGMSTHLNPNMFDILKNRGVTISGSHRLEGIFGAYGPDIRKDVQLSDPIHTWDVACTILHIHGLAIPNYMDGVAITKIFSDNSILAKTKIEQEVMNERLRIREKLRSMRKTGEETFA